jgi:hypothetical protein
MSFDGPFDDNYYSGLFDKIDVSPKRGRIRPKSASFKNIYRPVSSKFTRITPY